MWVPFKMMAVIYKALHGIGPGYLRNHYLPLNNTLYQNHGSAQSLSQCLSSGMRSHSNIVEILEIYCVALIMDEL